MRDWHAFVRERLSIADLTPEREQRIVRELAAQLTDAYRDALGRGLDEAAADAFAVAQIADWPRMARDLVHADARHLRPGVDRLVGSIELRPQPGVLLMLANAIRDARYALRQLMKTPAFTAVAVLTLALGTGATAAIFSVVNGVLLRPLPYPGFEQLVRVHEVVPQLGRFSVAPANFIDWRAQNSIFDRLGAYSSSSGTFMSDSGPDRVAGASVTWDMFHLLGVAPELGSGFAADQEKPNAPLTIVLSHDMWMQRYGGEPAVVGRSVTLNGNPVTIVGVMPAGFYFPARAAQYWQPQSFGPTPTRGGHFLGVVGRMKDGVTIDRATTEMRSMAERLGRQYPSDSANESAEVVLLRDQIVGAVRPALLTLLGAVGVVVLIVCANVANLLLVRASVREKEVSIRAALGASRSRLMMQLIAESLVLAGVGGSLGVLLAYAAITPIQTLGAGSIPRAADIVMDGRVLAVAAVAAIATGLIFGILPAWHASRPGLGAMLKEGGRSSSTSRGRWLQNGLLVVEVALSIVLLIGASLLLRSFAKVTGVDPGFNPEHVLAFQVSLPQRTYPTEKADIFYDALLERLHSQPGVQAAGLVQALPMRNSYNLSFELRGKPKPKDGEGPSANYRSISAEYLQTLGVKLIRGRMFGPQDLAGKHMVAVVDDAFAKRYFRDEEPIGQGLDIGNGTDGYYDVVGVVGDVHSDGLDAKATPTMYVPFKTDGFGTMWVVVRGPGDPSLLASPVRQVVRELDRGLPTYSLNPLETVVSDSVAQRRFSMLLLSVFAGLALFLAAIGLYGVVSYMVSQRTREIGLRLAIGAPPSSVLAMVVGGGMKLAAIGVVVGLAGAVSLTRLVKTLLFEVDAADPLSYVATTVALLVVAAIACLIPARRAMRVDPLVSMQAE